MKKQKIKKPPADMRARQPCEPYEPYNDHPRAAISVGGGGKESFCPPPCPMRCCARAAVLAICRMEKIDGMPRKFSGVPRQVRNIAALAPAGRGVPLRLYSVRLAGFSANLTTVSRRHYLKICWADLFQNAA